MKLIAALAFALLVAACSPQKSNWHATDITGAMPPLDLHMTRANDGKAVTGADYTGKVTILYFGYTHCPDICPTTLANLAEVLDKVGTRKDEVRVVFVTVDPTRDTPKLMKGYVNSFAPQVDGLYGTANQLADLARRYRVAYKVTPASPGHEYEVMHANAVFFFDKSGRTRLVTTDMTNIDGLAADVTQLLDM